MASFPDKLSEVNCIRCLSIIGSVSDDQTTARFQCKKLYFLQRIVTIGKKPQCYSNFSRSIMLRWLGLNEG